MQLKRQHAQIVCLAEAEKLVEETLGVTRGMTELIIRKKASAGQKVAVMNMCVLTKVCYPAKFCQWDEEKLKEIEGGHLEGVQENHQEHAKLPRGAPVHEKGRRRIGLPERC